MEDPGWTCRLSWAPIPVDKNAPSTKESKAVGQVLKYELYVVPIYTFSAYFATSLALEACGRELHGSDDKLDTAQVSRHPIVQTHKFISSFV